MPITLDDLLVDRGLGLTLLTESVPTDVQALWAHTCELADPSPWLEDGALIMTLGLGLPDTADGHDEYVRRLAERGVVGLAIDTGIVLDRIPQSVIDAGERHQVPILRIPPPTPFIAISRAVLSALTLDALDAVTTVAAQQDRVAAAALKRGADGVVTALSSILDADVAVLDMRGHLTERAGRDIPSLEARVRQRLGGTSTGKPVSLVHVYADEVLTIQSFTGEENQPQILALSSARTFDAHDRLVLSHAVTLLSLLARTPQRLVAIEGHLRSAVARSLLVEGRSCDAGLATALGFEPSDRVVAVHVAGAAARASALADRLLARAGGPVLRTALADGEAFVMAESSAPRATSIPTVHDVTVGLSRALSIRDAAAGIRQARSASRIARLQGRPAAEYVDLQPVDALLTAQPPEANAALVRSVLGPLLSHDERHGTALVTTVEAYLSNNGYAEGAATALQIHRHTLRRRLEKATHLLRRDLDNAAVRVDLWVALRALDVLQSAEEPSTVPTTGA
ncbi:PucR family transcriptional regulator [Actinomycetota bacterium]